MGEVVVDGLDVGVHGGDHVEADADATTDVDEHLDANEGAVHREQLLHDDGGVVPHELIEQTVEPGIGAVVLERRHPVVLVEGDATLQHRILQVVPGVVTLIYEIYIVSLLPHFHEELIVAIHTLSGHGTTIVMLGQVLADGGCAVLPQRPTIRVGLDGAADDTVGREQAENSIYHVDRLRVLSRQLGHNICGAQLGARTGLENDVEELELDGRLWSHGEDAAHRQLQGVHSRLLVYVADGSHSCQDLHRK